MNRTNLMFTDNGFAQEGTYTAAYTDSEMLDTFGADRVAQLASGEVIEWKRSRVVNLDVLGRKALGFGG